MSLNSWMRRYNLCHNKVATLIACTAATALATITFTSSFASAAFVTVYGGPTYTPGVGGFQGGSAYVNEAGIAVGSTSKYGSSGEHLGSRSFRWDASSAAPTELGNLGVNPSGYTTVVGTDINNAGTVVGEAQKFDVSGASLGWRAVRWNASGTAAIELENLGGDSIARAINNAGTAVGESGGAAVRWDASGNLTELGNLGSGSSAWAINDAGTAVGRANKPESLSLVNDRAVRWGASGTAATELGNLGTFLGRGHTDALDINDAGTAVGWAHKHDGSLPVYPRAVRWNASGTAATELGNLGTGIDISSYAEAINNAGTAIGEIHQYNSADQLVASHAVRWAASGTATELGNLGTDNNGLGFAVPQEINNAGIAVGWAEKYDDAGMWLGNRAVYWGLDAVAVDLNTLIDPAGGWRLVSADAISDTGWIVGSGDFDPDGPGGQDAYQRLFLMHVPEPATVVLFGVGLVAMLGAFMHRSEPRRTGRRANQRHAVRRPTFEALEDRLTLSYVWDGIYYTEPPPGVVWAPELPLLADFTSDGIPDQISANYISNNVAVRPGHGDGTFGDPISSFVRAPNEGASGVFDLNRDGQLDVVVASIYDNGAGTAWMNILWGAGNGSFFTNFFPVDFIGYVLVLPVGIGTGDLFGTGRTDLVVAGNTEDHGALYAVLANTPELAGDYNYNDTVDAADYVVWRKTLGTSMPNYSGADGDGNGVVDQDDHAVWRAHFGQTLPMVGSGSLVAAAAPLPALAQPEERGSVEPPDTSAQDAALAVLDSRWRRFIPQGNTTMRRLHALPTTDFGMNARANDLLLVHSSAAKSHQQLSEEGLNSSLTNDLSDEAVETRREALDIAISTLLQTWKR
jgi:hypothetical protein